jgi:hypothetical protein
VIRVAAASLCVLVGLYWLGVGSAGSRGGAGFLALVVVFTCVSLAGAAYAIVASRGFHTGHPVVAIGALGLALFAVVGPWLLNEWIRGDSDRYIWVIRQGYPCSHMGGGPGTLWVFGTSWLAALGSFIYAVASGLIVSRVVAGLGLGAFLLAATAAAMFPDPAIFARLLGCI